MNIVCSDEDLSNASEEFLSATKDDQGRCSTLFASFYLNVRSTNLKGRMVVHTVSVEHREP